MLRLGLALLILYSHSAWIVTNTAPINIGSDYGSFHLVMGVRTAFRTLMSMAVPMFFALSGFLVAASAERNRNVLVFLSFRGLRIFPALMIEVALSACLLGPVFTSLNLDEYFSARLFFRYLGNVLGWVSFYLPGVFENNPVRGIVNVNLWTLPAEFDCYLLLSALMVSRLLWSKGAFTALFAAISVFLVVFNVAMDHSILNGENFHGYFIVYYFAAGLFFFVWRDKIRLSTGLFAAALVLGVACLAVRKLCVFSPIFIVYVTVYLGMLDVKLPDFIKKNDYSYGIYLYGFPICQSLRAAFPQLEASLIKFRCVAVVLTLAFAALSWHLLERKALSGKKWVKKRLEALTAGHA